MPALGPNSLIVVTGVTGYIASHVALFALREGHRVRGTIRPASFAKAESLRRAFVEQGIPRETVEKRLEFVPVDNDDFSQEETWLRVFNDADGIQHVAFPIDDPLDPIIVPVSIHHMEAMLLAAKRIKTIKRFVYTSSILSVIGPTEVMDRPVSAADWNNKLLDISQKNVPIEEFPTLKRGEPLLHYGAAKLAVEKLGFEFIETEQPQFDFVSILPGTTLGPVLFGKPSLTPGTILSALRGDKSFTAVVLSQTYVDVRDVAKLHHLGLVTESMGGKRWIAVAGNFGWNEIFSILRKLLPGAPIPDNYEDGAPYTEQVDTGDSTELLGGHWIRLRKSVQDTVDSFRKLGIL